MTDSAVFLDSGIFIAFLNRRDRHHEQAVALFGGSAQRWYTSWLVVSETYSWFLHRHGEESARSFRVLLGSLEPLHVFDIDDRHHTEVCRILDHLRGSKLTYVDASSLALMERANIGTVWSTDRHLGLMGARVLPRS